MKYLKIFTALAVTACGTDASAPNDLYDRYELISLLGQTPPIAFGPTAELDQNGQPTGVTCQETLHSEYIELSRPNSARRVIDLERNCSGRPAVRNTTTQTGSFTHVGDTLRLTFHIGGEIGNYTVSAVTEPNRLKIATPIYTEADPDGSSGQVAYTIYEAR